MRHTFDFASRVVFVRHLNTKGVIRIGSAPLFMGQSYSHICCDPGQTSVRLMIVGSSLTVSRC